MATEAEQIEARREAIAEAKRQAIAKGQKRGKPTATNDDLDKSRTARAAAAAAAEAAAAARATQEAAVAAEALRLQNEKDALNDRQAFLDRAIEGQTTDSNNQ